MKIAIVTTEFLTESIFDGGLSNYTYRLCSSLISLGQKPYIFVCSNKNELIYYNEIPVYRVKIETFDNRLYYSTKKISKIYKGLKKFLLTTFPFAITYDTRLRLKHQSKQLNDCILKVNEEINFDIIHYAHLGAVGFHRPNNIPCVSRLSSSTSEYEKFGGYGTNINEVNEQERLELQTLKKMDGVFGPSKNIIAKISKQINKQIEIIETPFVPEKEESDFSAYEKTVKGKKYLLFYGTIGLIKGAGTIAEIIYPFLKTHPDHYFVFIGKTLHSEISGVTMIDHIKNKARELSNRVLFLSKMPHSTLYPILQNCSFCVLPSRIDNFPNTCIESMAHHKIVIGTRGNGFEQLITDGVNGFLVNIDDPADLLNKINYVINLSNEEKIKIETEAAKRIDLLKPEIVVTQLIDFYKKNIQNFKN